MQQLIQSTKLLNIHINLKVSNCDSVTLLAESEKNLQRSKFHLKMRAWKTTEQILLIATDLIKM